MGRAGFVSPARLFYMQTVKLNIGDREYLARKDGSCIDFVAFGVWSLPRITRELPDIFMDGQPITALLEKTHGCSIEAWRVVLKIV